MSIIQQIRDKAAWAIFILIALSLLGFLLMDALVGRGGNGLFNDQSTSVGVVNGKEIEQKDYELKLKQMEDQYARIGYPVNEMMRQGMREQAWSQFVTEEALKAEVKKLGLDVSDKELNDILYVNPPQDLKQAYTNEQGVFDVNRLKQMFADVKKKKEKESLDQMNTYLNALVDNRLQEKYVSLLTNSVYYPKWMAEKQNSDNNAMAAVSYVHVPYATIVDSTIKVSDEDIAAYVAKHKEEYKQTESRSISYVAFDAAPSGADTTDLINKLENLKAEFASTSEKEMPAFLLRSGSALNYADIFATKSNMQVPYKDSIQNLADGQLFGPYLDATNLTVAKMMAKRTVPDSIKARHILIKLADQRGQYRDDSTAKKLIDSIAAAIKGGADFNEMVLKYSEDEGSKNTKGEYDFKSTSNLVKPFYDVVFYKPVGTKEVVKAESNDYVGYHYIEVLSQKNFETAYKVAYLSKPILPSQETQDKASGLANQFAAESRTPAAFDENARKRNYNKLLAADIKPLDAEIPGLGNSRQLVRWIYEADKGDISEAFNNVGDKSIVVMVTEINKEGTMSPAKARPMVEFIIRNQKKAEQIKKSIGNTNTLDAVAAATKMPVLRADSVTFQTPFFPNAGQEPKVGGYAFSAANKGKVSAPLAGTGGVFVIKTENIYAKPSDGTSVEQQRQAMMQNQKAQAAQRSFEALKKNATVKDNRAKFY
ncbi:MAG: peptidylprolyl isomerase [Flavihumibacter sp.]|nr:peptidylprolyl isomerase [Flavihumibacter sp.]